MGAVLSIKKDGIWHPIAFSSHSMMPQERNYPVTDKEMLLVIQALEQWCHYLEGARHQFDIWNDHTNLQWFMTRQDLNRWQAQWAMYLLQLWFYEPSHTMTKPDAFSIREDHTVGIEDDNKGIDVITPDKIRTAILITDDGDKLKQKIFNATCLLNEADIQRLRRTPSVENAMVACMMLMGDYTYPIATYYGRRSSRNTITPWSQDTKVKKNQSNCCSATTGGLEWLP